MYIYIYMYVYVYIYTYNAITASITLYTQRP